MNKSIQLSKGKKLFFASDFHLGCHPHEDSIRREKMICRWLDKIAPEAHAIYLLGDIFDFWFEYKHVIPKGSVRIQAKLAELVDQGIEISIFTGNHDVWMFDYLPKELGVSVYTKTIEFTANDTSFFLGHGDGLGPGDYKYKFLKGIFANKLCQWAFKRVHPNLGLGLAHGWSKHSRIKHLKTEFTFDKKTDFLFRFCQKEEEKQHRDLYIFGHRHLVLDVPVKEGRYINLGEWVFGSTFGVFDGKEFKLEKYEE